MPEVSSPAQVVVVDYVCDTCKKGHMFPDGVALTVFPPKYPHTCNECGATDVFRENYPATRIVKDVST